MDDRVSVRVEAVFDCSNCGHVNSLSRLPAENGRVICEECKELSTVDIVEFLEG